jgi:hypothetical protein
LASVRPGVHRRTLFPEDQLSRDGDDVTSVVTVRGKGSRVTILEHNDTNDEAETERQQARKRVQARRDFTEHLVTYVVVNALLIMVWVVTGAGYFWPIWVIGPWGVGLVLHAWETFFRKPITEADIDAELTRHHR